MKALKRISLLLLILLLGIIIYMAINFLPIMTGMAAKTMCSCVYVMHRDPESVVKKELTVVPFLDKATLVINDKDSSVEGSLLGSKARAFFRKGLGCTLLAKMEESKIRQQAFQLAGPPPFSQDTVAWPSGDRPGELPPGIDFNQIKATIDSAFLDIDPTHPINTQAVVVVYQGQIIGEQYASGITKDSRLMGWSMTKSITNAMVGLLVGDGKLKVEQPAPVSEWSDDTRSKITINNLLQASSGLAWSETYFLPGDFHNMFIHSDDKGGYAASKELKYEPNEYFEYSSGTTNILSRMVRQTLGDDQYHRYVYDKLFYRIGMHHTLLEPDASGTFVGSSYGYASARDWARFGLLYLNDGVWNGQRILPEGWVNYSSTPAAAATMQEYGAQWWLNAGEKGNSTHCKEPGLPNEAILAEGFERQYVVIIPSKKLVIVRLGITHNDNFNLAKLVKGIMAGVGS